MPFLEIYKQKIYFKIIELTKCQRWSYVCFIMNLHAQMSTHKNFNYQELVTPVNVFYSKEQ